MPSYGQNQNVHVYSFCVHVELNNVKQMPTANNGVKLRHHTSWGKNCLPRLLMYHAARSLPPDLTQSVQWSRIDISLQDLATQVLQCETLVISLYSMVHLCL